MEAGTGIGDASAYLRELLSRPGPYRRRWERRASRLRGDEINQRAIGRVLADTVWSDGYDVTDSSLKDRVARALAGEVLSPQTLTWFIAAFDMKEEHAEALWAHLLGSTPGRLSVVAGQAKPPPSYPGAIEAREYRTVSLHEYHTIGGDGMPAEHRSIHVIESLTEGLRRYPYRFDTNAAAVEVVHGGTASPLYRFDDNLYAVDIRFSRPLTRFETASLEYRTIFSYVEPPAPEFRRAVFRRLESLQIRVSFHPDKLPATVWWATWEALDGEPTSREEVVLDDEHAAHRYVSALERAIVGFRWRW